MPYISEHSRHIDDERGFSGGWPGELRGGICMSTAPLMPKATAVWLVDNTTLTFDQIANFCVLHPLEVKAIADGDSAQGIKGMDPVLAGQLQREEIEKAEKDPNYRMKVLEAKVKVPEIKRRGPRYTPVSKRQDRPNAILWLVRNHPELKDAQIMRLVGTTKPTIQAIRERTHWNSPTLAPTDPVTLGLCTQIELDMEVRKAARSAPLPSEAEGARLLSAEETTAIRARDLENAESSRPEDREFNADSVFSRLKSLNKEEI
jgi:hypothetical protein